MTTNQTPSKTLNSIYPVPDSWTATRHAIKTQRSNSGRTAQTVLRRGVSPVRGDRFVSHDVGRIPAVVFNDALERVHKHSDGADGIRLTALADIWAWQVAGETLPRTAEHLVWQAIEAPTDPADMVPLSDHAVGISAGIDPTLDADLFGMVRTGETSVARLWPTRTRWAQPRARKGQPAQHTVTLASGQKVTLCASFTADGRVRMGFGRPVERVESYRERRAAVARTMSEFRANATVIAAADRDELTVGLMAALDGMASAGKRRAAWVWEGADTTGILSVDARGRRSVTATGYLTFSLRQLSRSAMEDALTAALTTD